MVKVASNMIPLGTRAPSFRLLDIRTETHVTIQALQSPVATVIMFLCNHCPFVKYIQPKLAEVAAEYQRKGISFIGINSNDVDSYPDDSPENMRIQAEEHHYTFPYLFDDTQEVARAYQAACTPDFYIFDKDLYCVYRGRFDDSTPSNHQPVTGSDLMRALDQILAGEPVFAEQKASIGCNIKWKHRD